MASKLFTLLKPIGLGIKLGFIHCNTHIAHMFYRVFAHPRYFLGGHRPSETSILTNLSKVFYFTLI